MSAPTSHTSDAPPQPAVKKTNTYDQDLLLPGNCGGSLLESALSDIDLLIQEASGEPKYGKLRDDIREKFKEGTARWPDLYAAQRLRLELLPAERLEIDIAGLRSTFSLTAGPSLIEKYRRMLEDIARKSEEPTKDTAKKPEDIASAREKSLRAEAWFLLTETQEIEIIRPHQEHKRLGIAFHTIIATLICVLGFYLIGFLYSLLHEDWTFLCSIREQSSANYPLALVLILTFGALGACMSAVGRLQETFCEGRMILNSTRYMSNRRDHWNTPLSGAIFALILSLIFASGVAQSIFSDRLVPTFPARFDWHTFITEGPSASASSKQDTPLPQAAKVSPSPAPAIPAASSNPAAQPSSAADTSSPPPGSSLALLLVWAFIAGFAERFVPDTLDRLVGGRGASKKKAD